MRGFESFGSINVSSLNPIYIKRLASPESPDDLGGGLIYYDMPVSWSFDFNLGITGNGQLNLYLSNDDPSTSSYVSSPVYSYAITAGRFSGNSTKLTLDSGFKITVKYLAAKFIASGSVSGVIDIQGTIIY
jgi:hypothetical protein